MQLPRTVPEYDGPSSGLCLHWLHFVLHLKYSLLFRQDTVEFMIYSILWLYRSNSGRSATLLYAYSSPERSNTLELKHLVYFVSYLTCPVCPSLYVFVLSISCEKSVASPCLVSVSLFSSVNLVCLSPCPNVPALLWQSLISLDSVHLFPQMCSLCPNLLLCI